MPLETAGSKGQQNGGHQKNSQEGSIAGLLLEAN